jgi:hypothetical protein
MLGAVTSNVMDKKIQSLIKNKNRYGTNGNVKKLLGSFGSFHFGEIEMY